MFVFLFFVKNLNFDLFVVDVEYMQFELMKEVKVLIVYVKELFVGDFKCMMKISDDFV